MHLDPEVREVLELLHNEGSFPEIDPFVSFEHIDRVPPASAMEAEMQQSAELLVREQQNLVADGIDASQAFTDQFCALIEKGLSRSSVCKAMGIDYRKFQNAIALWRQGEPDKPSRAAAPKEVVRWAAQKRHWEKLDRFFTTVGAEEARLENRLLDPQVSAATHPDNPDLKVGQWLLERRFSRNWGKVSNVKHQGKPDKDERSPVRITQNIIATGSLSEAELEAMDQAHKLAKAAQRLK